MDAKPPSGKAVALRAGEERAPPAPHDVEAIRQALSATEALTRESRIAIAAYYQAERRGFAPGGEIEDWLAAERDMA